MYEGNKSPGQLQAEWINAYFLVGWEGLSVLFPGPPAIPEVISSNQCHRVSLGPVDTWGRGGCVTMRKQGSLLISLHLHPSTAPLTKGRHGWTVHILPYNFFYCRNSDLSGGCVFIWGGIYLSINWSNYVILHDEFIQWALNLEPSRSQMYNWCHLLLPSLLLFLEKMVLREGPGPRAGIPNLSFCLSDQGPLLHCWPWWSVILNLLPSGQSFVCPT